MRRDRFAASLLSILALVGFGCGESAENSSKDPKGTEQAAGNNGDKPANTPGDPGANDSKDEDDNPLGIVRIDIRRSHWDKLKQIGLGFWGFHEKYRGFPQPSHHKEKEVPKLSGKLSWRVWLLVDLEEYFLYDEFNTTEDWDSEQNRKLIAKMPVIFNSVPPRNDGKTTFHVFVGDGAPLSDERITRDWDYQDRLDKTILVIEAGPDKAVEWTKPGGLEFDPKNPKACLGNVPDEFQALMMDGSVRKLSKDISNEELLELITGGKKTDDKKPE